MEIRRRRRPGRPRPGPGFRAKLGGETAGGEGFRLGSRIGASLDAVRVGGVRFCCSPGLRPAVGDGPPAPAGMGGQDAMVKVNHPIYRVRGFEIVGPYVLHVAFDDGTVQTIDFEPVLAGELFGPLRDPALFRQVWLDPEVHTLVWPNGADFDPATLHDWPDHVQAFMSRARSWATAAHRSV